MTTTIGWIPLADCKPSPDKWVRTKREGEAGENICARRPWPGEEDEWVERSTGVTTVTHHSFAPPTHWLPLEAPKASEMLNKIGIKTS